MVYAGFGLRAIALLVDLAVWVPILVLHITVQSVSIPIAMASTVAFLALVIAYPVYFLSRWGQTLGKMAAGIRVVRLDGGLITQRQAWLRSCVDIALVIVDNVAILAVLATWTGPEWSSLTWTERGNEVAKRSRVLMASEWVDQAWIWSELVVLLFNQKKRALHDFIAGTVVIQV